MFKNTYALACILMLMLSTCYCDELHAQGIDNSAVQEAAHNDSEEILKWYLKRAEQGEAKAQYFLALLYRNGDGTPVNCEEAVKWFQRSAEQGYSSAQLLIGLMYKNGEGVPVSYVKAYAWMSLSSAQGDEDAKRMVNNLANKMTSEQIVEAQKQAAKLKQNIQKQNSTKP